MYSQNVIISFILMMLVENRLHAKKYMYDTNPRFVGIHIGSDP